MLVGPELPAGVTQQDMGDYGGALLPGRSSVSPGNLYCACKDNEAHSILQQSYCLFACDGQQHFASIDHSILKQFQNLPALNDCQHTPS